jgi:hypothetical protein
VLRWLLLYVGATSSLWRNVFLTNCPELKHFSYLVFSARFADNLLGSVMAWRKSSFAFDCPVSDKVCFTDSLSLPELLEQLLGFFGFGSIFQLWTGPVIPATLNTIHFFVEH